MSKPDGENNAPETAAGPASEPETAGSAPETPTPEPGRRITPAAVARVAGSVALIGACAALVVQAGAHPVTAAAAPTHAVRPTIGARDLVCPGNVVLSGSPGDPATGTVERGSTDKQFAAEPAPPVVHGSWSGPRGATVAEVPAADKPIRPAPLPQNAKDLRQAKGDSAAPLLLQVPPEGAAYPQVAAATVATRPSGDLTGVYAASCVDPAAQVWLVGGSTALGHSTRAVLVNPGFSPVTVDLDLYTPSGLVAAPAGRSITVPAGRRVETLLEGLMPAQPTLAVGVRVSGGRIGAYLTTYGLQGLTPTGADAVQPSAPPSRRQVIQGVFADASAKNTVRVLNPGTESAVITWRLMGAAATDTAVAQDPVTLAPGAVTDVPLRPIPDRGAPGRWTAVVESNVPVVAGLQLLTGTPASDGPDTARPTELLWSPSTLPVGSTPGQAAMVPVLDEPASTLLLAVEDARGDGATASVLVEPVKADGSIGPAVTVEMPSSSTRMLARTDYHGEGAVALRVHSPDGSVYASMLSGPTAGILPAIGVPALSEGIAVVRAAGWR